MRIDQRLNLGFLAIAMWAAVVGHISLYKLKEISAPLKHNIPGNLESVDRIKDLAYLAQVMLYYDEVSMQSLRNYAFTKAARWQQRFRDIKPKIAGIMREMINKATEEDLDEILNADKGRRALLELDEASIRLVNNGKAEEAIELLEGSGYQEQREVYARFLKGYARKTQIKHDGALLSSIVKRVRNSTESSRRLVSLFALAALLIALGSGIFISRSISKPLAKLRTAAAEIGKGNLGAEVDVKSNDEIGLLADAFKKMTGNLKKTTTSIDNLNREVKERKKAEEKYRTIFENSAVSIMVADDQERLVSWNRFTEGLLRMEKEDLYLRPIKSLYPAEEWKRIKACDVKQKGLQQLETSMIRKDGRRIDVDVSLSLFENSKDKTTGSIGVIRDITERNKAEKERQLAEKRLSLACEELEKANRELKEMQSQQVQNAKMISIGQLAAGVAHELNTPIGFVGYNFSTLKNYVAKMQHILQMYAELIEDIKTAEKSELLNKADVVKDTLDSMRMDYIIDDMARLFDDSQQGLERVTNIVASLKDFSRVDGLADFDEYNINDGIKTTLVVARNEIKYHADVKTEFSEVCSVVCNPGQINQVILNLLVNAAQAIKSQERSDRGLITIKTYSTDDEVICEISDDGPGIEPDNLQHIFDPFFTTKPVGLGTGLGLSISYDIISTKHNGKLTVDTSVGKGTTFTIELPINRSKTNVQCEVEDNGNKSCVICG
ncbi:MAG: PAS domain S-box protein [Phycisphaerales bacterium]|nr:MAG: PAS domain S-box protein [Phycisphaerales bacterium]